MGVGESSLLDSRGEAVNVVRIPIERVVRLSVKVDVDPKKPLRIRERVEATLDDGSTYFPNSAELSELAVSMCNRWLGAVKACGTLRRIAGLDRSEDPRVGTLVLGVVAYVRKDDLDGHEIICADCGEVDPSDVLEVRSSPPIEAPK